YGVTFSTAGTWYVRAIDSVNGIQNQQDNIFVTDRPNSWITLPVDDDDINELSSPYDDIYGGFWDDEEVTEVQVAINKGINTAYWWEEGTGWANRGIGNRYWNDGDVWSSTWTYTGITNDDWVSGYNFVINCRAKDNRGNFELSYTTSTFFYDNSDPVTVITNPEDGVDRNTSSPVKGTAVDVSRTITYHGPPSTVFITTQSSPPL
ncbi:unnamed protein product, partial [marine sediment metagenome]